MSPFIKSPYTVDLESLACVSSPEHFFNTGLTIYSLDQSIVKECHHSIIYCRCLDFRTIGTLENHFFNSLIYI